MPSTPQKRWLSIDEKAASIRLPAPYRAKFGDRASRAATRFYVCLNIWPWELVPQYTSGDWGLGMLENLAIIGRHIAQDVNFTVEDLRRQLVMSIIVRSGEGEVKLRYKDVRAVRAEFLDKTGDRICGEDDGDDEYDYADEDDDEKLEIVVQDKRRTQPSNPSRSSPITRLSMTPKAPSWVRGMVKQTPQRSTSESIRVASAASPSPPTPAQDRQQPKSSPKIPRPSPTLGTSPSAKRPRLSALPEPRLSVLPELIKNSPAPSGRESLALRSPRIGHGSLPSMALVYSQMLTKAAEPQESPPQPGSIHESLLPAITDFVSRLDSLIDDISRAIETTEAELESKLAECEEITNLEHVAQASIDDAKQALRNAQLRHATLVAEADEFETTAISLRGMMGSQSQSPCLPQLQTAIDAYNTQKLAKQEEAADQEIIVHECATDVDEAKRLIKGNTDIVAKLKNEVSELTQDSEHKRARWGVLNNVKNMVLGLERTIPDLEDMALS
ncbi:hypothetical protein AUP68_09864 [Ilyonectria robusta]